MGSSHTIIVNSGIAKVSLEDNKVPGISGSKILLTSISQLALLSHALAAIGELTLYYLQWYRQDAFHPQRAGKLALFLCIVQSVTNLQMVKHLRKGHPYIVRKSLEYSMNECTVDVYCCY